MPTPPVTLPTGTDAAEGFTGVSAASALDAARERPDRATVFAAVTRTEELLAGMLLGHTVLAAGAFVVLAAGRHALGADPDRGLGGGAAAALPALRDAAPAGAAGGGRAGRPGRARRGPAPAAPTPGCCWR